MINLRERMLPTLARVEPATSWSTVWEMWFEKFQDGYTTDGDVDKVKLLTDIRMTDRSWSHYKNMPIQIY